MRNASGERDRADDRQSTRDAQPSGLEQPSDLRQPGDLGMIAHCRSSPTRVTGIPNAARGAAVSPQIRTQSRHWRELCDPANGKPYSHGERMSPCEPRGAMALGPPTKPRDDEDQV